MRLTILRALRDETGSLAILICSLFTLLLIVSFTIVDVSDSFLAKRELVEVGETAITQAAHQISLPRYYAGNILMDDSDADGAKFRVPLDCEAASSAFRDGIDSSQLRGESIVISAWSCQDDEVTGSLQVQLPLLVKLPFGLAPNGTTVSATVAATSIIGGSR